MMMVAKGESSYTYNHSTNRDIIINVLDDQNISTHKGRYQKFLVHWQGHPLSTTTWITATDFQRPNLNLYEQYRALNSSETSLFKQERVDAMGPRFMGQAQPHD